MATPGPLGTGRHVRANGQQFYVVDSGGDGEAVALFHGFPNDYELWRHQVPQLAKAGFRTVAIDLRGYGQSDRPRDVSSYEVTNIVKDVEGILDELNIATAHLIGHDWGATVGWAFAGYVPERTSSLTAISVGHPDCFFRGPDGFKQRKLSWYMLLFLVPGVADKALVDGGAILDPLIPTEGAEDDYARMFEQLARPATQDQEAAVTAGLNWYRANVTPEAFTRDSAIALPHVSCNTMMVYPTGDAMLLNDHCPRLSGEYVDAPGTFRYEVLEAPTHFPSWDAPEATTELLLDFLTSQRKKHPGS